MSLWIASKFADEIASGLNSATFSASFEAKKRFVPIRRLEGTNALEVSVVPAQTDDQVLRDRRARATENVLVLIAVQKTVEDLENNDEIDPLAFLAQEIADWIRKNLTSVTYESAPTNVLASSQVSVVHEQLLSASLFSAFIEVSYRTIRP